MNSSAVDNIRYVLGVAHTILIPLGMLYWFVIHGWAREWRKIGAARTYLIVLPVLMILGVPLFRMRQTLLGHDLRANWALIAIAAILCVPMMWLEIQYWKHVNISMLAGVPEVSLHGPGKLLCEGVYGIVRHPRYLSAGIGEIVTALIVNYLGFYLLLLAAVLLGVWMLKLEERELVERFGEDYRRYQRNVPSLIPRWPKSA